MAKQFEVKIKGAHGQIAVKANAAIKVDEEKSYNVGDSLPDGWIVGPISPDTGKPVALEPVSSAIEGFRTWHQGEEHARFLLSEGNTGARQPSEEELSAIYNKIIKAGRNHNAKLKVRDTPLCGSFWSGTTCEDEQLAAQAQDLVKGIRYWIYKGRPDAYVRCIRDEPGLKLA